jgi:SAM-dependent methyltransferase
VTVDADAFDSFESGGWELAASAYDRFFGAVTGRVIDQLLDAAGVSRGSRMLDVATGPGYAAARAAARGADAVGLDAAAAMVDLARRKHPTLRFVRGSANDLPFADGTFDAAVGNFLILHLGEPERAAAELARVLVPGAGVALSTWDLPEHARLFGAVLDAISDVGVVPPTDVPAGPSFFRFAEDEEFMLLLSGAGFGDVRVSTVSFAHPLRSADELFFAMLEGTVRTSALLRAADEQQRESIRAELEARLEPFRTDDGFLVPVSVKIGAARRSH